MNQTNPVIGVLLFAVCFGGWPLFLFACFRSHPRGISIVLGLTIVTFLIGSFIGSLGVTLRSAALLYSWLALPYLLVCLRFVYRRHTHSDNTPPAVPK
jgi:ABC-type transport system involved in multi-copper enzyme maturation permease subunit